ncbi:maleylpyruvate isomerase family mycothiol-dependent enzyme [Mycobacterium arosiense]|uniref:Mycothiol-dependent maleylpyruvate isomerase metal-binding domain-containing protein n=1 Tax=Mycobacterium arosiense ATCC BAA-1401 = DSM 45069 TaxID=1265311 RepID=A0A1W9Z5K1_MYCAI|nr:maleylpyruvate isomerase family mycothiol-dependent enzyme [Mycobacterium arosiense]ORA07627.1 hypothetical protein BST14_26990 [Mycobacterium arosiense ATCC BAA-1401 = DSM 45069]
MADRPVTKLDKSTVLTGLFAVWDDIDALLGGLSEAQWRAASPLPGWDVKALVSHMIGTESFLAGIAAPEPDVDVSALDHVRNNVGVMNECWVRHLSAHADADVLESFRAITADRSEALTNMSGEEWDAATMTPTGPDSYGRFMRIRVFDCWMHEQDIRVALARSPSDDELAGPAASLAVDEIAATMGYVVGKLAKAPEGSRIQFDLTGPLTRTIRVSVDGRAAVVDDFAGQDPTSTIRLDGLQFTRLAGGRPMCPARAQDIDLDGDKGVAAHVVEHLNFVI